MIKTKKDTIFLNMIKFWGTLILIISLSIQIIVFKHQDHFLSATLILMGWLLCVHFVLNNDTFIHYTMSGFLLLGYAATQFWIPSVFTIIENKPLSYNLKAPIDVFFHMLLAYIFLIISFLIYKYYFFQTNVGLHKFLHKYTSVYNQPKNIEMWVMGGVGIFGMLASRLLGGETGEQDNGGGLLKLIQGFRIYAYIPLFLLVKKLYSAEVRSKNYNNYIIVYIFLLIILGIALNSRGTFMQGITGIGMAYFLGLILGRFSPYIISLKNIALGLFTIWLITGPLSDLGTAMVMARNQRSQVSTTELLQITYNNFQNKEAIQHYKQFTVSSNKFTDWQEHYFDNIFISRFANPKFADLNLELATKLETRDNDFGGILMNKIWVTFPQPILNIFNPTIDKAYIQSGSIGDFLYHEATGSGLGGFRTGNFIGTGYAAFGWYYLPLLAIFALPFFILIDSLNPLASKGHGKRMSILGLLNLVYCFTYFGISTASESITSLIVFFIRGYVQLILLYILIQYLSKKISSIYENIIYR